MRRRDVLLGALGLGAGVTLSSLPALSPLSWAGSHPDLKDRYFIFCLFQGAWDVLLGLDPRDPAIFTPDARRDTRIDVGYDLVSDDEVVLRFEVSVTPGASVRCALEVQNEQHAIVGWKVVDLPGSDTYTRVFEERIITSEPAVVGLISECRLT